MSVCSKCGEACTPQHQWIDLTATEIKLLRRAANNDKEFAALLIARFKEKNT